MGKKESREVIEPFSRHSSTLGRTAELHTKHSELVQSFENEGFGEIDAKKQAFAAILTELRKELGNAYMDCLQWMTQLKRDPVHRKIMKTRDAFVAEDEFDPDEALVAAVKISLGTYVRRQTALPRRR